MVDAGDGMTGDMVSAILSPAAVHRDGGRSGVGGMRAVDGHAGVAAGGADSADESKRKRAIQALK